MQDHHEFVPTKPAHRVARSQATAEALGDGHQQLVPHGMAMAVIDGLEVVQVEVAHRQVGAVVPGTLQFLAQALTQQGAIGQAGERILVGQLTQLLVDQPAFEPLGEAAHHDREHGHLLVAPAAAAPDVVEAREPFQPPPPHQGEHQQRLNALGAEMGLLGIGPNREIGRRLEIDRPPGPQFP